MVEDPDIDWDFDDIKNEEESIEGPSQNLGKKAELVAAQIVDAEILNCIAAALNLRHRFGSGL